MTTFIIYDEKTGDVLHTHAESDGERTSEAALLQMVDVECRRDGLRVLAVDPALLDPDHGLKVDPSSGRPVRLASSDCAGSGNAQCRPVAFRSPGASSYGPAES